MSLSDKIHAIEEAVHADWSKLEAAAKAEAEKVLGELKTDAGQIEQQVKKDLATDLGPLVAQYRNEIEHAIEAAGPSVTTAVTGAAEKILAALSGVLGVPL